MFPILTWQLLFVHRSDDRLSPRRHQRRILRAVHVLLPMAGGRVSAAFMAFALSVRRQRTGMAALERRLT